MLRWSTTGAAVVLRDLIVPALRDVLIPAGGLYGILTDRPLVPLAAGAYLVMMGLPVAGWWTGSGNARATSASAPAPRRIPPVPAPRRAHNHR